MTLLACNAGNMHDRNFDCFDFKYIGFRLRHWLQMLLNFVNFIHPFPFCFYVLCFDVSDRHTWLILKGVTMFVKKISLPFFCLTVFELKINAIFLKIKGKRFAVFRFSSMTMTKKSSSVWRTAYTNILYAHFHTDTGGLLWYFCCCCAQIISHQRYN